MIHAIHAASLLYRIFPPYPDSDIDESVMVDLNWGNVDRGICALPYTRLRDSEKTWFPVNPMGK